MVIGLIIALAIYYHFVTLPKQQESQRKYQYFLDQQQQATIDDDRDRCLQMAQATYLYDWNKACQSLGVNVDPDYAIQKACTLGSAFVPSLEQHLKDDKDNCFKAHPVAK